MVARLSDKQSLEVDLEILCLKTKLNQHKERALIFCCFCPPSLLECNL